MSDAMIALITGRVPKGLSTEAPAEAGKVVEKMSIIQQNAQIASSVLLAIMNDPERNTATRVEAARILIDLYKHIRPSELAAKEAEEGAGDGPGSTGE